MDCEQTEMGEMRDRQPQILVDGEDLGVFIKDVDERVHRRGFCYLDRLTGIMEIGICISHDTQESEAEKIVF